MRRPERMSAPIGRPQSDQMVIARNNAKRLNQVSSVEDNEITTTLYWLGDADEAPPNDHRAHIKAASNATSTRARRITVEKGGGRPGVVPLCSEIERDEQENLQTRSQPVYNVMAMTIKMTMTIK